MGVVSKSPISNISAGSLIVVLVVDNADVVGELTDDAGNTYILANQVPSKSLTSWSGNSIVVAMWYVPKCKALSTSQFIEYTTYGTSPRGATMGFISSTYEASMVTLDQNVVSYVAHNANISITSGVPNSGGEFWVVGIGISPASSGESLTQAPGWSSGPDVIKVPGGAFGQAGGFLSVPNSDMAAKTYAATWSVARSWIGIMLSFKAS